jgi:hypothetical protein
MTSDVKNSLKLLTKGNNRRIMADKTIIVWKVGSDALGSFSCKIIK